MKLTKIFITLVAAFAAVTAITSCNDSESYAELLTDETKYVNAFLSNHIVINSVPENNAFQVGEDAPYYRLDSDGNVYMQVLRLGTQGDVQDDQQVYFRYTRYNLEQYDDVNDVLPEGSGNSEDLEYEPTWFRFNNYTLTSSSQYGAGIQMPLNYVPLGSEVNIVVKSQYGMTSEIAYVIPFLYNIRYYRSKV